MPLALALRVAPCFEGQWRYNGAKIAPRSEALGRAVHTPLVGCSGLPRGLGVAVETRPHDTQDGDNEQDSEGHVRADEGGGEDGGEDGGHDVEGGRGGMDQRGEEGGDGAGEGGEHEGGEAERPDAGAGLIVGHASPPAARLSHR